MQTRVARQRFRTAAPARAVAMRRPCVVVAVKPTKAADFRSLSDSEIIVKIGDLKAELASVRFMQRTRGISEILPDIAPTPDPEKTPKTHLNKHLRRQVAQLNTVLRERTLAAGISARESRKAENLVKLGMFNKPAKQI